MKRILFPLVILLLSATALVSCLGDDESSDITYYKDAAISSFTLGTLNRTIYTKTSDGTADSSYTTTVTGSNYVMTIDQVNDSIYNTTPLPVHTDISKVVCSVSSKNSGIIVIKRETSDTLDYYTSSDSIDFTNKRDFYVYSTDGTSSRRYSVKLNVLTEHPDSFTWESQQVADLNISSAKGIKSIAKGDSLYLFATDGTKTSVFVRNIADASATWSSTGATLDADAYKNIASQGGYLYTKSSSAILRSADGAAWQTVCTAADAISQLAGATSGSLYAINTGGAISVSTDGGQTWAADNMDTDTQVTLPTGNVNFCVQPLATSSDAEQALLIGTCQGDTASVVWSKIEDNGKNPLTYSWTAYEGQTRKMLPAMSSTSVVVYDGNLLALGGSGLYGSQATAYDHFYVSVDHALTWSASSLLTLPNDFYNAQTPELVTMAVDKYNYIWVIDAKNSIVWKTIINNLK